MSERTDYQRYLALDELLSLQRPRALPPVPDELLFIVVHQVSELWFRLLVHELVRVREQLLAGRALEALPLLERARRTVEGASAAFPALETLPPAAFARFRALLEGSGFESVQFREIEFLLGRKRARRIELQPAGSAGRAALERRLAEPSLYDAFLHLAAGLGAALPQAALGRPAATAAEPDLEVQRALAELVERRPEAALLAEALVDLDQALLEWRYRHVRLVERTIGHQPGTGGSTGVPFLRESLFEPFFADLWRMRGR